MSQVIFKYVSQVFVGLATRKPDGTLDHQGFVLMSSVPKEGDTLFGRQVAELLTDEVMLSDLTRRASVEEMKAVAVLGKKV